MNMLRRPAITVPDTAPPKVAEAASNLERLRRDRAAAVAAIRAAEDELARAERSDADELAAAMVADTGEPAATATAKAADALADARRRLRALEVAVAVATDELTAHVDNHLDEWAAAIGDEVEAARQRYATQVEALVAARRDLDAARTASSWLQEWAGGRKRPFIVRAVPVPSPDGPARAGTPWGQVERSLRADATPPPPSVPQAGEVGERTPDAAA